MNEQELREMLVELRDLEDRIDKLETRLDDADHDAAFYLKHAESYVFTAICSVEHDLGIE